MLSWTNQSVPTQFQTNCLRTVSSAVRSNLPSNHWSNSSATQPMQLHNPCTGGCHTTLLTAVQLHNCCPRGCHISKVSTQAPQLCTNTREAPQCVLKLLSFGPRGPRHEGVDPTHQLYIRVPPRCNRGHQGHWYAIQCIMCVNSVHSSFFRPTGIPPT